MFIQTLTKRKILLWIALLATILVILFYFLDGNAVYKYIKDSQAKYAGILEIPANGAVRYIWSILAVVFLGLWFIFAFIYIYSKNNIKARQRKWPYIVLIVFTVIGLLFSLFIIYKRFTSYITVSKLTSGHALFQKQLDDEFTSRITTKIFAILTTVSYVLVLSLSIVSLVLIKKEKGEADIEYSKTVVNTGKNIEESKTSTQSKNNKPDDLP